MKVKKNKKVGVFKVLIQTLIELLALFKYNLVQGLTKIAVIIQIAIPVVIVFATKDVYKMLLLSIGLTVLVRYIKDVGHKLNGYNYDGIPVPPRRYTKRDNNGFIELSEEDTAEALVYLNSIEEYFKSKGRL